jgi:hypothetical protein
MQLKAIRTQTAVSLISARTIKENRNRHRTNHVQPVGAALELWRSSASPTKDKKDDAHHQEQKEQKLGNSGRGGGDASKSKHRCH